MDVLEPQPREHIRDAKTGLEFGSREDAEAFYSYERFIRLTSTLILGCKDKLKSTWEESKPGRALEHLEGRLQDQNGLTISIDANHVYDFKEGVPPQKDYGIEKPGERIEPNFSPNEVDEWWYIETSFTDPQDPNITVKMVGSEIEIMQNGSRINQAVLGQDGKVHFWHEDPHFFDSVNSGLSHFLGRLNELKPVENTPNQNTPPANSMV